MQELLVKFLEYEDQSQPQKVLVPIFSHDVPCEIYKWKMFNAQQFQLVLSHNATQT